MPKHKKSAWKPKRRSKSGSSTTQPRELSYEENKRLIEAGETYRGYKDTGWKRN